MTFENQHPVLSLSQLAVEHGWENAGREGLITSFVSPLRVSPTTGLEGAWFMAGFTVCPADAVSELVSYLLRAASAALSVPLPVTSFPTPPG